MKKTLLSLAATTAMAAGLHAQEPGWHRVELFWDSQYGGANLIIEILPRGDGSASFKFGWYEMDQYWEERISSLGGESGSGDSYGCWDLYDCTHYDTDGSCDHRGDLCGDVDDLGDYGWSDRIRSLQFRIDNDESNAIIELYEHDDHGGENLKFWLRRKKENANGITQFDIDYLGDRWNDEISSLRVSGENDDGIWYFYKDSRQRGDYLEYPEDYDEPYVGNDFNDRISSIRLVLNHGNGSSTQSTGWSTNGDGCGGQAGPPVIGYTGSTTSGTMLNPAVFNGPPTAMAALLLGFAPLELKVSTGTDCWLYLDPAFAAGPLPLNAQGSMVLPMNLPPLSGFEVYMQWAVVDPSSPWQTGPNVGVSLSERAKVVIQ